MAAKQRETRHELEDGFVVVWDSSEPDEELRERLIEVAAQQIGDLVVEMGGAVQSLRAPAVPTSPRRGNSRQRRAAA